MLCCNDREKKSFRLKINKVAHLLLMKIQNSHNLTPICTNLAKKANLAGNKQLRKFHFPTTEDLAFFHAQLRCCLR